MKRFAKVFQTLMSVNYAYMLEYRAELLFWVLSGSLPLILMGAWIQASANGNFGLSGVQFAQYFLATFIVRQFTVVWVIWDFEREVVEGKLSFRLLQPIDPIWHHLTGHWAERFARLPFLIFLVPLFFGLYPQALWWPSLGNLVLFAIVVHLAFFLRFLMQYTLAMFAFWTERATSLENFWFLFYLFLSGYIAPLNVFPPLMREIALWTPFPYMVHFPACILVGLPVELGRGLLVMSGWTLFFIVAYRWLWKKGLRQYSGMGA